MASDGYELCNEASRQKPQEAKAGYLKAPQLTDSLLSAVCNESGLGCQILLRMSRLLPEVPLKRRLWYDTEAGQMGIAKNVLTYDQQFDSGDMAGISVNVLGISEVNFVESFWSGHVQVLFAVSPAVYLRDWGFWLAAETKKALLAPEKGAKELLALLDEEQRRWKDGLRRGDHLSWVDGFDDAENFMRFLNLGIVSRHFTPGDERPKVSGSRSFWWEDGLLRAYWTIDGKWYHEPTLRDFPFDTNELSAIFWTRVWNKVGVLSFPPSYGLGTKFNEFEVLGFRGDPRPWKVWDPYHCECNVVPNHGRPDHDVFFYGRFWVRRKPFYFVAALVFPTGIVALMASGAILVAAGDAPNAIVAQSESPLSFIAGLMLTMSAMKFSYAESLPKLGYLTMLDTYVVASFLLLSLSALLVVVWSEASLHHWHLAEAYCMTWLLFNIVFFTTAWKKYRIPDEYEPSLTFPHVEGD